jgi:dihydroxy-acid dehydratase
MAKQAREVYGAKDPNNSFPPDNIRFRSRDWFDDPERMDQSALYLERFMNYGITPEELRSGKPIIGIAQTGSDLVPCNRHHLEIAPRVRDGIRDAGGIPMEFPVHPLFENCLRPTAALDRNLAYLGLVEILYGYPLDAVVLTTGCDKTTPSGIMAASRAARSSSTARTTTTTVSTNSSLASTSARSW